MPSNELRFGGFRLDVDELTLWHGTSDTGLRRKAVDVLRHLAERPGTLLTKDKLLDAVWPDRHVDEHAVADAIKAIRDALADDARQPRFIENVHGKGYRFIAELEPAPSPFTSLIEDKAAGFTGRQFVIHAFDQFLQRPRGHFVVEGEPGIGKTSLAAYLVKARGYAHYFADAVTGIGQPEHFRQLISRQLIEAHRPAGYAPQGDYRDASAFIPLLQDVRRVLPQTQPLVILVDAFDEAQPEVPGTNRLQLPSDLPDGVYFFVTSRPLQDIPLFAEPPPTMYILDAHSADNRDDVRRYLKLATRREALRHRLQTETGDIAEAIEMLMERSEGNFMYLRYVLSDLEKGEISATDLPQGLKAYYERHWRKMRSRDGEHWLALQQPVISVLAAARDSLSLPLIAECAGRLPVPHVAVALADWREFLRVTAIDGEARYALYHSSFRDFLHAKAEVREVYLKETNTRMAQLFMAFLRRRLDIVSDHSDDKP